MATALSYACLRPFVSLRDCRVATQHVHRSRRHLFTAHTSVCRAAAEDAAASPPPQQSATAAAAAPKFASLPLEQQRQIDAYLDILLDWNQRMNLTGEGGRGRASSHLPACMMGGECGKRLRPRSRPPDLP